LIQCGWWATWKQSTGAKKKLGGEESGLLTLTGVAVEKLFFWKFAKNALRQAAL